MTRIDCNSSWNTLSACITNGEVAVSRESHPSKDTFSDSQIEAARAAVLDVAARKWPNPAYPLEAHYATLSEVRSQGMYATESEDFLKQCLYFYVTGGELRLGATDTLRVDPISGDVFYVGMLGE